MTFPLSHVVASLLAASFLVTAASLGASNCPRKEFGISFMILVAFADVGWAVAVVGAAIVAAQPRERSPLQTLVLSGSGVAALFGAIALGLELVVCDYARMETIAFVLGACALSVAGLLAWGAAKATKSAEAPPGP